MTRCLTRGRPARFAELRPKLQTLAARGRVLRAAVSLAADSAAAGKNANAPEGAFAILDKESGFVNQVNANTLVNRPFFSIESRNVE